MLIWIRSFGELDLPQLMHLHSESICCNGRMNYPDLSENMQIIRAEQDFYDDLSSFFTEPGGTYAVWASEGHYCSALRIEPYSDGLLLSCLETAQEMRRKGCAAQLIRAVLDDLKIDGHEKLYSHVNKGNISSLRLHDACGFKCILDHAVYIDGSVYHSSCTFCYTL